MKNTKWYQKKGIHDCLFTRFVVFFNGNLIQTLRQLIVFIQMKLMNVYKYKLKVAGAMIGTKSGDLN